MSDQPASAWRAKLRAELTTARKNRDDTSTRALRSVLSAIDNAETPDAASVDGRRDGPIADAVSGLGAAEVPRRDLTDDEIYALLRTEITERTSAAELVTAERAATLRAEAAVITRLLGDV